MGANRTLLVFRREFRSTFLSPIAYIVISVFLVVTGWFFFSPFFVNNRADLRDFFALLPLVLAFVIPAITMRLFADEYRAGTFEITQTLPIPLRAIIAGKFFAAWSLVAIMLLPTISYPIFISTLGDLDWGPVIGGYLAALLLGGAYTAIGTFASSLSRNQIVAYVVGIAICAFLSLVDRMLPLLPGGIAGVLQSLSADYHFGNIAKGIFDTRDLVYFLTVPAIALYATALRLDPPRIMAGDRGLRALRLGAHASAILFVIVANIAFGTIYARVDLTEDRIHSLSPVSRDTIAGLREPLTIRAFFSRNLPAPYNNVEQSLRDLLDSYALINPDHFNYAFYSMTKPEETLSVRSDADLSENERLAQQYGIVPIQIQEVQQDEMRLTNAYMGVAILHGDSAQTIGAMVSTDKLEYELTTAIRDLTARTSALLSRTRPISIELYLSSSLTAVSPSFGGLPSEIGSLVDELNAEYYNRLAFAYLDPSTSAGAREAARALQLSSLTLRSDAEAASAADVEAYATVVIDTGDDVARINLLRTTQSGTQLIDPQTLVEGISENLDTMLAPQLTIGYMVGNGTPPFRGFSTARNDPLVVPDLSNFYQLTSAEYEFDGYFARNGVPEGVRATLVVAPRQPFSQWELFQIDQFLMSGGSLILFLDAYDIEISGNRQRYTPRVTGLERMIEHYGVKLTQSYLLDMSSYVVNTTDPSGIAVQTPVYSAPMIDREQLATEFGFLSNIDEMVLINVTPLELTDPLPEGVVATELVSSSPDAWVLEGDFNATPPTQSQPPPATQREQYPIAYLLEGQFTSFFADKTLPEPPPDYRPEGYSATQDAAPPQGETVDTAASSLSFLPSGNRGRIFVMGGSMTLGNSLIDPEGQLPGSVFALNTIDFMNDRPGIAELRSKGARFRPLGETTPLTRGFTRYFNVAGLPILVIVAGLIVLLLHHARRRRIARSFAGDSNA